MRILFIAPNRIGDAVLTTGLLSWLETTYPSARFTLACGAPPAPLFRALPRLDSLLILKKKKAHGHWLSLWRRCALTRWDLIVDTRNTLVTRLLWAQKKVYKPAHASGRHKVEDLATALNVSPPPSPRLWLDAEARTQATALLPPSPSTLLALAPAANWPPKQWPIERFIALTQRLTSKSGPLANAHLLIVAAPHEREQLAPLFQAFPKDKTIDAIGCDLLTIAACLEKADLFVGNDSGLMHIAAAMGAPTLGLFGPSYEAIYGPWGKRTATVRTQESAQELFDRLPYPGAFAPLLMDGLSVEAVHAAAQTLLSSATSLKNEG